MQTPFENSLFKQGVQEERARILKMIEIRKHTVKTLSSHSISRNLVRQVVWELDRLAQHIGDV